MSYIENEIDYLKNVLNKELINSSERNDNRDGYQVLARKYWPEYYDEKGHIKKPYQVHHIDFDHSNNVVSNLVILTYSEHINIHYMFDPKRDELRQHFSEIRKGRSNGRKGCHHSEETKQKLRESATGRKHTEESKKKMSLAQSGKNNGMYGKHQSEAAKEKLAAVHRGKHWKMVDGKRIYY